MTPVIIPVSRRDRAKERLAPVLSRDERAALASALFVDVVGAIRVAGLPLWVVTSDPNILQNGLGEDIGVIEDPPGEGGLNAALDHARQRLAAVGETSVLILPADLPLLDPGELAQFLELCEDRAAVGIVPAHDAGTNALYLAPPTVIPLRFGLESSVAHRREAEARGLTVVTRELPSFRRDLDTPDDLREFLSQPSETETYQVAERLELRSRFLAPR